MRRFFQSQPPVNGQLVLEGGEAVHAARVMRLEAGDAAIVLDGVGSVHRCRVDEVAKKRVLLSIESTQNISKPRVEVRLFQSLVKGKAFDVILQKAVELGATEIVPIETERGVARVDERDTAGKIEKWNHVAIEAIKQCGSAWLPTIHAPLTVATGVRLDESTDLKLVASLEANAIHPRQVLQDFSANTVSIWIGPEGDFTAEEYDALRRAGVKPVTLGERVLRSETAAICALTILGYEINSPR